MNRLDAAFDALVVQAPKHTEALRPAETAKVLGISLRTLEKWRGNGKGPQFFRAGRLVRYRLSDLEAFMRANAKTST